MSEATDCSKDRRNDFIYAGGHNIKLSCRPDHRSPYRLCRTYQHFIIRPGGQLQRALGAARSLRADGQQPSVNVLILLVFFIKARSEPSNIKFFHRFHIRAPIENLIQTLFLRAPNIEFSSAAASNRPQWNSKPHPLFRTAFEATTATICYDHSQIHPGHMFGLN